MAQRPGAQHDPCSRINGVFFSRTQWRELGAAATAGGLSALLQEIVKTPPAARVFDPARDLPPLVDRVLVRLPVYLAAAKRPPLAPEQVNVIRAALFAFGADAFTNPRIDARAVRDGTEFAGLRTSTLGHDFYLTADGVPDLVLFNTRDGLLLDTGEEKTGLRQAGWVVDVLVEVIGMILSIIGLSFAATAEKAEKEALHALVKKLLTDPNGKEALKRLIKGINSKNLADVFAFFEYLEQTGNLTELFAHWWAGLSWVDFALTVGKFLLWLAATTVEGPAAIAIQAASLALDLIGIGLKLKEAPEIF